MDGRSVGRSVSRSVGQAIVWKREPWSDKFGRSAVKEKADGFWAGRSVGNPWIQ